MKLSFLKTSQPCRSISMISSCLFLFLSTILSFCTITTGLIKGSCCGDAKAGFMARFKMEAHKNLPERMPSGRLVCSPDFSRILASFGLLAGFTFTPINAAIAANNIDPEAIEVRRIMAKLPSEEPIKTISTVRLPSGVEYFDVAVGEGREAVKGTTVQFNWVLRRSNGYFVDSSTVNNNSPFIYKVGNTKKVIEGLDQAIEGMKAGGVRRVNIPPKLGFVEGVDDGKPGPIPNGFGPRRQILTRLDKEVWYFEIQMLKVK